MSEKIVSKLGMAAEEDSNTLDLSWSDIDDEALETLLTALPDHPGISQIWLNNNKLTDKGVASLAKVLPSTSVTKLWINGNKFGDEGLRSLADMLVATASQEDRDPIDEFWCIVGKVGNDGTEYFANKLSEMKLRTLWLWAQAVGDEALRALAAALPNTELYETGLGGNSATDEAIEVLFESLPKTNLVEFYCRWNAPDCDKSLATLADALGEMALEKLSLDNSSISDKGLAMLGQACEESTVEALWVNGQRT